jgi:tripartite-type tricarboxylate transporter receptor subunit TctC
MIVSSSWAADKYPSRTIELWFGSPPGGIAELQNQALARYMEKYIGAKVMSVCKQGGSGVVQINQLRGQRPDGYKMASTSYNGLVQAVLQSEGKMKLDDIRIVAQWNAFPHVLVVHPSAPWKTMQELVEYTKKNPGTKIASTGVHSAGTLRMENLNRILGMGMETVAYQGPAEIVAAILGRHQPVGLLDMGAAKPHMDSGRMRLLLSFDPPTAYGLDPKTPSLESVYGKGMVAKDVPTVGFVIMPKKTPDTVVATVEQAVMKACEDPELTAELAKLCVAPKFLEGQQAMKEMERIFARVTEILPQIHKK